MKNQLSTHRKFLTILFFLSVVHTQVKVSDLKNFTNSELDKLRSQLTQDFEIKNQDIETNQAPESIKEVLIEKQVVQDKENVDYFGYSYFERDLNFFDNSITPSDYKIGPGDAITVSLWGEENFQRNFSISKEGSIYFDSIGFINLSNLNLSEVEELLTKELSKIYSTINSDDNPTYVSVQLKSLKSLNIYFTGEVKKPGINLVHPFSDIFSALVQVGGININGSLRNIQLIRDGKVIQTVDFYAFFTKGDAKFKDIKIIDSDIIHIPKINKRVEITGSVTNPGFYELIDSESFIHLSEYAGGLNFDSGKEVVIKSITPNSLSTSSENRLQIYNTTIDDVFSYNILNGDTINISKIKFQDKNVSVLGRVKDPGQYLINKDTTLKNILDSAGGFEDLSFVKSIATDKIYLSRKNEDSFYPTVIVTNYKNSQNIQLDYGDIIFVYSNTNYFQDSSISISGEINYPGNYKWEEGLTVNKLIQMSGGKTLLADMSGLRVLVDDNIIKNITVDNNVLPGYEVVIPKLINHISVSGNVENPGMYIFNDNKTISNYLKLAGGSKRNSENKILVTNYNGKSQKISSFRSKFIKAKKGDQIIILEKDKSEVDVTALASDIASLISSILTVILLIDNMNTN